MAYLSSRRRIGHSSYIASFFRTPNTTDFRLYARYPTSSFIYVYEVVSKCIRNGPFSAGEDGRHRRLSTFASGSLIHSSSDSLSGLVRPPHQYADRSVPLFSATLVRILHIAADQYPKPEACLWDQYSMTKAVHIFRKCSTMRFAISACSGSSQRAVCIGLSRGWPAANTALIPIDWLWCRKGSCFESPISRDALLLLSSKRRTLLLSLCLVSIHSTSVSTLSPSLLHLHLRYLSDLGLILALS